MQQPLIQYSISLSVWSDSKFNYHGLLLDFLTCLILLAITTEEKTSEQMRCSQKKGELHLILLTLVILGPFTFILTLVMLSIL